MEVRTTTVISKTDGFQLYKAPGLSNKL